MEIEPNREDSKVLLHEATVKGCVTTLKTLIQNDPLILNKLSLTSFTETPLHISALLGHFHFTATILELNPKLASEYDSFKRYPLHLASAEGHKEIVKALLYASKDVCLFRDQDGRIPLHFAAMRGRVEVIEELVTACPESIRELLDGDTILHLFIKYNHLEALKLLLIVVDKEFDDDLLIANQDGTQSCIYRACQVLARFFSTKLHDWLLQLLQYTQPLLWIEHQLPIFLSSN